MESICSTILGLVDYHFHPMPAFEIENLKSMDGEGLKKFRDFLKTILEYYKSSNKKSDLTLKKLHLQRKDIHFEGSVLLAHLNMLQTLFGTKKCSAEAFCLSYLNHKKRKNMLRYPLKRLINSISMYNGLLTKIFQDLRSARRCLESYKENTNNIPSPESDIDSFKVKILMYQGELKKWNSDYSWLNDKKWSFDYFHWEIQSLNYVKNEKQALQKELDRYEGLHPDLHEAAKQLQAMEYDCREYWRQLTDYK